MALCGRRVKWPLLAAIWQATKLNAEMADVLAFQAIPDHE